jgi:putative tryptophan/tyrosine transport system ATP-binding protein
MENNIQINNIEKSFSNENGENKKIISGISLNLQAGDFYTIIGANGSGKSTLFNCIAGTIKCDNGEILIGQRDLSKEPEKIRSKFIGRVLQDPKLGTVGNMTLLENLRIAFLRNQKKSALKQIDSHFAKNAREKIALLDMGLETQLEKRMDDFSGGQRQALSLIMSIMHQPELLLMDEPSSALDPKSAHQLLAITKNLSEKLSLKILMITHNFREAIEYGNKLLILKDGKISQTFSGPSKSNLSADYLYNEI